MTHHPIHPPGHMPTEVEHRAAYYLWVLKDIVYDSLLAIHMARTGQFGPVGSASKEGEDAYAERRLQELLKSLFDSDKESKNPEWESWEHRWPYEKFKADWGSALVDSHCGDCTAVAAPCLRCHAEDLYGVPGTATWMREGGKKEGWRLLHEYRALKAKEEAP